MFCHNFLVFLMLFVSLFAQPNSLLGQTPSVTEKKTAQEILALADEVRSPNQSYLLVVDLENQDGARSSFEVKVKNNTKAMIRTTEPKADRGRNILMIGENMWAYIPNLKRAVRVALSQKLSGETANGDIGRMRWTGDYEPVIESETASTWTLLLKANKKGLTYEGIRLWVEKSNFRPQKAQYLSLGGDVLKEAVFQDYRLMENTMRPGTLIIKDAKRPEKMSRLTIKDLRKMDFPEAIFQESNLGD